MKYAISILFYSWVTVRSREIGAYAQAYVNAPQKQTKNPISTKKGRGGTSHVRHINACGIVRSLTDEPQLQLQRFTD